MLGMIWRYLVLLMIIVNVMCINLFNKVQLTKSTTARCLDGSPYAFYTYQPDTLDPQQNKLLIYFEDTAFGWCIKEDYSSTLEQCHKFATADYLSDYGSSKNYSNSQTFLNGILSLGDGGAFRDWRKVLIKSCDGGSYIGNRDPIQFKKIPLYFRGSRNVIQAFNYLYTSFNLTSYEQIVISGSFNGGVAAMIWSPYLSTLTLSPIRVLVEATVFPNTIHSKSNTPLIQNRMKAIQKIILNGDAFPNQQCSKSNVGSQWKCLFVQQLSKHIIFPIFYAQSLYDGAAIQLILGYSCAEEFGSLSECSEKQREAIKDYSNKTRIILSNILSNQKGAKQGAFGIACVSHKFFAGRWANEEFQVPMNSGNMVIVVVDSWIKIYSKVVHIDKVEWPQNVPCARKAISFQE